MKDLFTLENYQKFWLAFVAGSGQLLIVCAPSDVEAAFVITTTEWYTVVLAYATAFGVRQMANKLR
jgi:hypothetical protein